MSKYLTIKPAPLSTNHIYKIASKPYPRLYMTAEGESLKEEWQWQIKTQWESTPIEGQVMLSIVVYYGDKRKRDIDNGNKILLDAMTGFVYKDDSQIETLTLRKLFDKENPRVEIAVTEL